jgi:hypothetical protein
MTMRAPHSPEDFLRSLEDAKFERRRQKESELALETRLLQPWERYRALVDHYDALQDVAEQGDRKTRFALLILGSLNAINLVIAMRGDLVGLPQRTGPVGVAYLASYALVSLGCCVAAIAALRPRPMDGAEADGDQRPLRFPDTAGSQTVEEYCENWRTAEVGRLTHELASLVHATSRSTAARRQALHRMYLGLYALVALTGGLVTVLAWSGLFSR